MSTFDPTAQPLNLSSLVSEASSDSIVAFAGGGQASATQLLAEINRVITVTTAGDSVKLPASVNGLTIMVTNHGAKPMQVYGLGTDTINDVATATGVSQMPNSVVIYVCSTVGAWYAEGLGNGYAGSLPTSSTTNAITAFATGGQTSAVPLTSVINRITVVGSAADSVKLPASAAGLSLTVTNAAATNSANVFPFLGDAINALGANAAFALAAGKTATFTSAVAGQWHALLSA